MKATVATGSVRMATPRTYQRGRFDGLKLAIEKLAEAKVKEGETAFIRLALDAEDDAKKLLTSLRTWLKENAPLVVAGFDQDEIDKLEDGQKPKSILILKK